MKFSSSACARVTKALSVTVFASLLSFAAPAQQATPPTKSTPAPAALKPLSADEVAKQEWRVTMRRTPRPKMGCFKATYPSTDWQEVPCTTAPPRPYPPASGPRVATVGNGNDFVAQPSVGPIYEATGSFDTVTGVTSVSDPSGISNFALQLNSNAWCISSCSNANPTSDWQQFIFSNSGSLFMQYWKINYLINTTQCPDATWNVYPPPPATGTSCWKNSSATRVPVFQTIADLQQLGVTGQAQNGTDTITLETATDMYTATGEDSVLNLQQYWQAAEFNVFGDCCSTQATFNTGSTIVPRVNVFSGAVSAPSVVATGFTGETNNLTLLTPACAVGGGLPGIVFTESNATGATAGNCSQPPPPTPPPRCEPVGAACRTDGDCCTDNCASPLRGTQRHCAVPQ